MRKTPDKLRIIIDADPLVYRIGFVSQSDILVVVVASEEDGEMQQLRLERTEKKTARKLLAEWLEAHPSWEVIDQEVEIKVEPTGFVLEATRAQINSIIKEVSDEYSKDYRDIYTHMVLSGDGNHRCDIATLKKYKGNRADKVKPVHYAAIRELLIREYGAKVVDGREADDEVSIVATNSAKTDDWNFVVASIDKDLDQIPGKHYDYMKKLHYSIDEGEGRRFFWYQVLAGDGTDNIPGAFRIGPKKAEQIMAQLDEEYDEDAQAYFSYDDLAWERVVETYHKQSLLEGCPYTDAEAAALENARLIYLQKVPGELWNPPNIPNGQIATKRLDD